MSHSYRAILTGNRLVWVDTPPRVHEPVPVDVIVQDRAGIGAAESDGARMAAVLEELVDATVYRQVADPVRWQRMVREDRPLPGRE